MKYDDTDRVFIKGDQAMVVTEGLVFFVHKRPYPPTPEVIAGILAAGFEEDISDLL